MPVDELCEKVVRQHVLQQFYHEEEHETAFQEISTSQFDNLVSSLNNLPTRREVLEKQKEAVSERLDISTTTNAANNSSRGQWQNRENFQKTYNQRH